ncbi:PREDICTED: uncharacterized protein LOC106748093 [Dinoponera quadriceps]|uniref:Uncharacterized protein LOC106748093 n=1 Tax=Dinoponera quadriceps TaxID=609295 RepID=A0A6P3XUF4_DINQU|nr:PREDICTED: uncharacterized protein LOC106748093 [Dinoponera quadriceps]
MNEVSLPEHGYRRVQNARRRQYVDCPTWVPSLCNLEVAQIQTEPKATSVVEIQTRTAVTKETPMQTLSKCDFCQRLMQPTEDAPGYSPLRSQDQWTTYPAILQVVRGIGMPGCSK